MRINLRTKLLVFSIIIAIIPLLIAGQSLIRIAQDEMKSAANDQLINAVDRVTGEINNLVENAWAAPVLLIRDAIDQPNLSFEGKIAILRSGIESLTDVVALQISIEGSPLSPTAAQQPFLDRLVAAGLQPVEVMRSPIDLFAAAIGGASGEIERVDHVRETGDWLGTIVFPLNEPLPGGARGVLSARIDLSRIKTAIAAMPFTSTGRVLIADASGREVFSPEETDISAYPVVQAALQQLFQGSHATSVEPYPQPDGTPTLAAFAFPSLVDWAVVAEKRESDAYAAVAVMFRNLLIWLSAGLAVAAVGALVFSLGISRPILNIGAAVVEVAKGNFRTRVKGVRSHDEIGRLATQINDMIDKLNERLHLLKFVSRGTADAVKSSGDEGVKLGGESREAAILFADIRGYTAFAENRAPEVVVNVINLYFDRLAELVIKNHGDIDKYVGDQIMAVFWGPTKAEDAVRCALDIQDVMIQLNDEHPDYRLDIGIGIDAGSVVRGAMGSRERMDYTVVGDHVNFAARLCGYAAPRQTLVSNNVPAAVGKVADIYFNPLEPIVVKGKTGALPVFDVHRVTAAATAPARANA
ncbi:MAG: HAMP domain-containing protein [Bauldia sp.]|nr:HAMP domain-containing protein [Bauldia sp.]